jgi:hypothetical protein
MDCNVSDKPVASIFRAGVATSILKIKCPVYKCLSFEENAQIKRQRRKKERKKC